MSNSWKIWRPCGWAEDYSIVTKTKVRLVLVHGSTIMWRSLEPDVVQQDIPACKFGVLQLSHYQNKVSATMHNTSWTDGGGMFLLRRDPFISTANVCSCQALNSMAPKFGKVFTGHVGFNKTQIALFKQMSSCCSTEICASTVNLSLLNPWFLKEQLLGHILKLWIDGCVMLMLSLNMIPIDLFDWADTHECHCDLQFIL